MTSPRRRPEPGVRRWTGLLLASLAMSAIVAPLLTPQVAAAAPLRTELRLTSFAPISVEPGKTVRAAGTFTTNSTLDDVVIGFEIGTTSFFSRSSISEAASTPPFTSAVFGAEDELKKVKKDETTSFSIRFPAEDLPLLETGVGVYPMRLVAFDASSGEELASVSSFLPWAPAGVGGIPSRLLMIWPIIGDSELTTATGEERQELLGQTLGSSGRLSTLVDAGEQVPATWVVDSAVLDQAAQLNTPAADAWLDAVAAQASDRSMMTVPYGDPDLAAVGAAGRPGFLAQGQAKADRVFQRVLDAEPRADLGWPADGAADDQTIDTVARGGDSFVLIDGENAPLVTPETYTPSGRIEWPDPEIDLLLADESASALVASPASTPGDVLLARQRFLAETYLHSLELPSAERLLVIAPPRRWDPSPLWAGELVDALRGANWLNPVSIDEAVEPSLLEFDRESPSIPEDAAARQLPPAMVTAAQQGLSDNQRLSAILTRPRQLAPPIEDALFTSVSTAWRSDPTAAQAAQEATLEELNTLRSRVRIVSEGGTLADDRGDFPVSVRNQLDQPVTVRLEITTTDPLRLRASGPSERITIGAERSWSGFVELDAVTSGQLSFDAQLLTPGGAAYSDPVSVAVDVRGFGQITLVVFGVAVALLVLAAAIRVVRRIRAARRPTA